MAAFDFAKGYRVNLDGTRTLHEIALEFLDALPLNATGKVEKNVLRDLAAFLEMDDVPFKPRAYEKAAQEWLGQPVKIGTANVSYK